jgi:Uma2 family endonuclease
MTQPVRSGRMTPEQFLAWERKQSARHEYRQGEVFAMAGGSPRHNALVANVTAELVTRLRGGPCRVLSSDQRIAIRATEQYVYADVSVVCGALELDAGTSDVLHNPTCLVEVLSPSTEAYDRGLKWEGYRTIATLRDYLLVSQHTPRIEHYQREPDGSWRYRIAEAGDRVTLAGGTELAVPEVFSGVMELVAEER